MRGQWLSQATEMMDEMTRLQAEKETDFETLNGVVTSLVHDLEVAKVGCCVM